MNNVCVSAEESFRLRCQEIEKSITKKEQAIYGLADQFQHIIVGDKGIKPQLSKNSVFLESAEKSGNTAMHGDHTYRTYRLAPNTDLDSVCKSMTKDELYLVMTMATPDQLGDLKLQSALLGRLGELHKSEQIRAVVEKKDANAIKVQQEEVTALFNQVFDHVKGATYVSRGQYYVPAGITPEEFDNKALENFLKD